MNNYYYYYILANNSSNALSMLSLFLAPACAISGRPPPRPSHTVASTFTSFPALYLSVIALSTATTKFTLSSFTEAKAIT